MDALLIGDNEYGFHEFDRLGPHIEAALEAAGMTVTATTDPRRLRDLAGYDAVVDYTTDNGRVAPHREALIEFVRDGGGYAGIHAAADLTTGVDEHDPEMAALVGGRFVGHPDNSEFSVAVTAEHPVTAGVETFVVYDEPYDLEYGDVDVLARMDHPELGDMPVSWLHEYGDGPVFYCSLGHTEAALTHDAVTELVGNGVRWVGGEGKR